MNTNIHNNDGASQEAVVAQPEINIINEATEKALEIANGAKSKAHSEIDLSEEFAKISADIEATEAQYEKASFAEKAKEVACDAWDSVKEFAHEVWEDEEGRKLLKDLGITIGLRLAFRHPLTAGIAIGIVGYRAWQEIKNSLADSNNH